jgi:hypothetical protein
MRLGEAHGDGVPCARRCAGWSASACSAAARASGVRATRWPARAPAAMRVRRRRPRERRTHIPRWDAVRRVVVRVSARPHEQPAWRTAWSCVVSSDTTRTVSVREGWALLVQPCASTVCGGSPLPLIYGSRSSMEVPWKSFNEPRAARRLPLYATVRVHGGQLRSVTLSELAVRACVCVQDASASLRNTCAVSSLRRCGCAVHPRRVLC